MHPQAQAQAEAQAQAQAQAQALQTFEYQKEQRHLNTLSFCFICTVFFAVQAVTTSTNIGFQTFYISAKCLL